MYFWSHSLGLQFLIAFTATAIFNLNSTLLIDCFQKQPASQRNGPQQSLSVSHRRGRSECDTAADRFCEGHVCFLHSDGDSRAVHFPRVEMG